MLLLATFFPDSDSAQLNGEYDVFMVSMQYNYMINSTIG